MWATCCKPLSGYYQLWTLHCSTIISALLGLNANELYNNNFEFHMFYLFFQTYGIRNKHTKQLEVMTYVDYVEIQKPAYVAGMRKGYFFIFFFF